MRLYSSTYQVIIFYSFLSGLLHFANAWQLDQSCNAYDPNGITNAVNEAISLANFAVIRGQAAANSRSAIPPDVLKHYMGSSGLSPFTCNFPISYYRGKAFVANNVLDAMGLVPGATSGSISKSTFVIKCTTAHFVLDAPMPNGQDTYVDTQWRTSRYTKGRCSPQEAAFTYRSHAQNDNDPKWVIVLCDGAFPAALGQPSKVIGTDWSQRIWNGDAFDTMWDYLSTTILHEIMHTLNDGTIGGTLPSGGPERTSWDGIGTLSDTDKVGNAESYSALASILWIRPNTLLSNGYFGPLLRFDQQPPIPDSMHGQWPVDDDE
jgi:hypothetical protein